jgi:pimeloyl-ACP methyl ester carboxylesterase
MPATPKAGGIATARLPNRIDLQYRETGDRNGLPLILLHGVTDSLHAWKPFTDALPTSVRALALSQRGHGDSSKPASGYESAAFATDIAAFMDVIGVSSAHVVAHSMGTWIAQRFARDYPDRVRSLTLIGGFVTLGGNVAVAHLADELQAMGDTIDPAFAHDFQASTVATPLAPEFLELVVNESLKVPARIWRAAFEAMITERPVRARLPHPALLMAGAKDALFDEDDRRRLAAIFTAPRSILYEALGHAPHWEDPRAAARDIFRFVSELALRPQNRQQLRPQGRAG